MSSKADVKEQGLMLKSRTWCERVEQSLALNEWGFVRTRRTLLDVTRKEKSVRVRIVDLYRRQKKGELNFLGQVQHILPLNKSITVTCGNAVLRAIVHTVKPLLGVGVFTPKLVLCYH
jgi:hypothetical protein